MRRLAPVDFAAAYDEAAIQKIIEQVGGIPPGEVVEPVWDDAKGKFVNRRISRAEALRQRLIVAANWRLLTERRELEPTDKERLRMYRAAHGAAAHLLSALHVRDGNTLVDLPTFWGPGALYAVASLEAEKLNAKSVGSFRYTGRQLTHDAIGGVQSLERWLAALVKRQEPRAKAATTRNPSRSPNRGRQHLHDWIDSLSWIWLHIFRRALGRSRPFARFIVAAGEPIGLLLTEDQARDLLRSAGGNRKAADSTSPARREKRRSK